MALTGTSSEHLAPGPDPVLTRDPLLVLERPLAVSGGPADGLGTHPVC